MSLDDTMDQVWVTGHRLDLRPLSTDDIPRIARHAGDARVACMTSSIAHPLPHGAVEAFVARACAPDRDEDVWALDARRSGGAPLVGVVSLVRMGQNQSEIGYWVAPHVWNTGIASDAVAALVAANPLGNCTIFASVFQNNPASARVLINCGFEYIGDAESVSLARGETVATWTYLKRYR